MCLIMLFVTGHSKAKEEEATREKQAELELQMSAFRDLTLKLLPRTLRIPKCGTKRMSAESGAALPEKLATVAATRSSMNFGPVLSPMLAMCPPGSGRKCLA